VARAKTRAQGAAVHKLYKVSPPAFHGRKRTQRVPPQRPPDPRAFAHVSQPEHQLRADLRAFFPFFSPPQRAERVEEGLQPRGTSLSRPCQQGADGDCTFQASLRLRMGSPSENRETHLSFYSNPCLYSGLTQSSPPSSAQSVHSSFLQAQEGERAARRLPNAWYHAAGSSAAFLHGSHAVPRSSWQELEPAGQKQTDPPPTQGESSRRLPTTTPPAASTFY